MAKIGPKLVKMGFKKWNRENGKNDHFFDPFFSGFFKIGKNVKNCISISDELIKKSKKDLVLFKKSEKCPIWRGDLFHLKKLFWVRTPLKILATLRLISFIFTKMDFTFPKTSFSFFQKKVSFFHQKCIGDVRFDQILEKSWNFGVGNPCLSVKKHRFKNENFKNGSKNVSVFFSKKIAFGNKLKFIEETRKNV